MGLKNEHVWAMGYAINKRISLLNNPFNELVKISILNIQSSSLFTYKNGLFVSYRF